MAHGGTQHVTIIGPESSGKTTLAAALAAQFGAPWVPEAARRFVETDPTPLSAATVEPIARLAMALDDAARAADPPLLFHDTDLVSTVVYARHYYGSCPPWIVAEAQRRRAQLYLLCLPDLPWEADGVRDQPHARAELFATFREQLDAMEAAYTVIGGSGPAREAAAAAAVRRRLVTA
ncbi:ATP-binding protein [Pseudogemmatithrix spongiicola]|uniref:ATP-binding protein n=1 Tax=Pseudogemmatithrix spongiicola TaxID=3062599 RepID=A0AA49K1D6_9BACT|nr:ATP-binding protein [Gemmatimonadaceae bacterium 'strain 138']WKW15967.1 ATP-binding protein [Gemmatimonadaceae bacterium 'strain 318']